MNTLPNLLIVEDDELSMKFFGLYLSKKFNLTLATTVDEFYSAINSSTFFDVILMDISLRDTKDGLQLTQELRQIKKYKDCPVIALTANVFKRDETAAYDAGINLFLRKPIDNQKLLNALLSAINNKAE